MVRLISILFILFNLTSLSSHSLRASFYVSQDYVYRRVLEMNPDFSNIFVLEPPVFVLDTYIVLHKRYKDLEPVKSEAIRELAESGRTAEIFGIE